MEFEKAMKIWERMCNECNSHCGSCPLGNESAKEWGVPTCSMLLTKQPLKAQEILEEWDKAHPQRTILDDFKEKYPSAKMNRFGVPDYSRPCELGYMSKKEDYCSKGCRHCWLIPLEEVEHE